MSPDVITPTGGVAVADRPAVAQIDGAQELPIRYHTVPPAQSFGVPVPARPPADLLLEVEVSNEDGVVIMSAVELDVTVEADNPAESFSQLREAIREWLEYLRDEAPGLAPELEEQRRFAELLNYEPGTWFGTLYLR
jgi:hypothetical protein